MAECESCGAAIVWDKTDGHKPIPLDAKPERRFVRTVDLRAKGLSTLPATEAGSGVVYVETYQTHFATCPNADKHRKPRG